ELWFNDRNLVIQAENSQFRVYRKFFWQLVLQFSTFKDMLSFPQPSLTDAEFIEGCPIVRLPDSSWEVTFFLKAIFLPEPFPAKTKFDNVVGCLRLSHKYGIDYLRRRALIHLPSGHPALYLTGTRSIVKWEVAINIAIFCRGRGPRFRLPGFMSSSLPAKLILPGSSPSPSIAFPTFFTYWGKPSSMGRCTTRFRYRVPAISCGFFGHDESPPLRHGGVEQLAAILLQRGARWLLRIV
ncbi:hypothetical protein C8R43DRAFT_1170392, partial [Mycena crocata]